MAKRKKIVKLRGSRTHGYGSAKKHRGKGSKGGKGMAGTKDHKKLYILKYMPNRLGKKGFKSLYKRRVKSKPKVINLKDIEKIAEKTKSKEIDLAKMGYDKLLGSGNITKPLTIKVNLFTKRAEEKIRKLGGIILKP